MSISANTAQTRELTELRNHLKWLDEERRKSGRKMAELEQKLAQQGRDLADRDHKIQELEWHVANFTERFERMPDLDTNTAGTEQRLQDLEWHLSNLNTQLTTRLPMMDEERARLSDEVNRNLAAVQERAEAGQSLLESRLRTEIVQLRDADQQNALSQRQEEQMRTVAELQQQYTALQQQTALALQQQTALSEELEHRYAGLQQQFPAFDQLAHTVVRLQEQVQAIDVVDRKTAVLQESVAVLSGQLRERTVSLAADAQTNISALASRLQEHLDDMTGEQQARLDLFAADWQARLDALPAATDDPAPELLSLNQRLDELAQSRQQWQADRAQTARQIDELAQTQQQWQQERAQTARQIDELAQIQQQWQQERAQMTRQIDELAQGQPQWQQERAQTTRQIEELAQSQQQLQLERAQLAREIDELNETIGPLQSRVLDLVALVDRSTQLEENLALVRSNLASVEENVSKLGHVREVMPILDRLEQELELRQAEEVRLSNLIGTQENRYAPLAAALEEAGAIANGLLSRVSESERQIEEMRGSVRDFNDNWKPALSEANRRLTAIAEKNTVLSNNIMKAEAGLQAVTGDQSEMRETVIDLTDEIRRNRGDVARQLEGWQVTLDENKDTIERFTQQWITLSNQYKEARMAVQNFAHWQKQLEQQKREASEMLRLESNRMQSRWDGFLLEIQEKLKNFELELNQKWQAFELENEQKWSSARRSEQLRHEELASVDELIQKLQQDNRNLIWRVQAAQADAIKKWPRLLMEEVEKAVELNPNRRLTSSGSAPRADMSVVDAIEQGLITIDYNDDAAIDL